jgi:single-strand DNA-binding protein
MPNIFEGTGNLADAPSIKNVTPTRGEPFKAAEMRIYFDEYSKAPNGAYEQSGGFWLSVNTYKELAEQCAKLLKKGARVKVSGRLAQFDAHDTAGNPVTAFTLKANSLTLSLTRILDVKFAPPKNRAAPHPADDGPSEYLDREYQEEEQF